MSVLVFAEGRGEEVGEAYATWDQHTQRQNRGTLPLPPTPHQHLQKYGSHSHAQRYSLSVPRRSSNLHRYSCTQLKLGMMHHNYYKQLT